MVITGQVSFVGGMNVPAVVGRMNATFPLAEIVIDDNRLTLSVPFIGRLLVTDFVAPLNQIAAAFRLKGSIMRPGVGVRLHDGQIAYFWTFSKQDAVLSALAARGVFIEPGEHRARGLWSLRRNTSEATLAAMPALLQVLTPVLVMLSAAIAIGMVMDADSWWARAILVLLWVISTAYGLVFWWRSRAQARR